MMPIRPALQQRVGLRGIQAPRQQAPTDVARAQQRLTGQVQGAIGAGVELHRKVVEEQDIAALHTAYSTLADDRARLLDDPGHGLMAQKGKNAVDRRDNFLASYGAAADSIRKNLGSDRQRKMFERLWDRERRTFEHSVNTHVANESALLAKQALTGVLTKSVSAAAKSARRLGLIGVALEGRPAIDNGKAALALRGQHLGWNVDVLDAETLEFTTRAHLGVMDSLLTTNMPGSDLRVYLDENRDEIDQTALVNSKMMARIDAAALRDDVRSTADRLLKDNDGDPARALDDLAAMDIVDTSKFDAIENRLLGTSNTQRQARRLAGVERVGRIGQEIELTGGFNHKTNPDYQMLFDEDKYVALKRRSAQRSSLRRERAETNRANRSALLQYRAIAAGPNGLETAFGMDLDREFLEVDQDGLNMLRIEKGSVKRAIDFGGSRFNEEARVEAGRLGLDGAEAGRIAPGSDAAFFVYLMREEQSSWREGHKGEEPLHEDVAKMFKRVHRQVRVDRWTPDFLEHIGISGTKVIPYYEARRENEDYEELVAREESASESVGAIAKPPAAVEKKIVFTVQGLPGEEFVVPESQVGEFMRKYGSLNPQRIGERSGD